MNNENAADTEGSAALCLAFLAIEISIAKWDTEPTTGSIPFTNRLFVSHSATEQLLAIFADGNFEAFQKLLAQHQDLARHDKYSAHFLLREFVNRNNGLCYHDKHLAIADLLTLENVRSFRDSVVKNLLADVERTLAKDPKLIDAEFAYGRGISQAIHHWASVDMGRLLVDGGANLEALTSRGESPLTMQLRFGTIHGVRFLLEQGVNVNHGHGGHMPSKTMVPMIELLLQHGWDINRGQLLHDANHGHGQRVRTWLKYGANPNATRPDGRTALHLLAARGTGREAIRELVEAGANIDALDKLGNTPLDLARQATHKTAANEIGSLGGKTNR